MSALTGVLVALGSSFTGRAMASVCLVWLVVERTGSGGAAGLVAAATTLPLVLGALLGGGLIDRAGARPTSITADLFTAVALAAIPAWDLVTGTLTATWAGAGATVLAASNGSGLPGTLALPGVLVLAAIAGTSEGPGGTARETLLPAVAQQAGVRLERANSWYKAVEASTLIAGPLSAGLLIATAGIHVALWVTAATFAVAALVTTTVVRPGAPRTLGGPQHSSASAPERPAPEGMDLRPAPTDLPAPPGRDEYLGFVLQGLRFAWADRTVRTMTLLATVLLACSGSFTLVVLPVQLNRTGSAAGLGLALGALGAGLVVGVLVYGASWFRLPRRPLALGCLAAVAVGKIALVALPGLPWLVVLMALQGLTAGPLNPLITTVLQERTPPALRGRVFGGVGALFVAAVPLGALLAGFALDVVGPRLVLVGLAAVFAAATVAAFLAPGLHRLGPPAPADPGGTRAA